ncbi:MAG TPA: hypothetical protein VLX68_09385 [Chitinivibrionales bacterium]|nr:hypothetical protein [Chitinivibrionales bacterium]
MKSKALFVFIAVLATAGLVMLSCAPYAQLKPKPELSSAEQGYIQLKNDKKDFELKKEKKYVIMFPAPAEDNFYLVLNAPSKKKMNSFFSATYAENKTPGEKIKDETLWPDSISVYAVNTKSPSYYWFMEVGGEDFVLSMRYRYAPQWRFKFETKAAEYNATLARNVVDRSAYKGIGTTTQIDAINFAAAIDTIKRHEAALEGVYKELLAIESIFPARIVNSTDPAYQNYKKLRANLEDEMNFQKAWLASLDFFSKEKASRGSPEDFLGKIADFTSYFNQKSMLAPNVTTESQRVLKNRFDEVMPYLTMKLSGKEDAALFDQKLYNTASLAPLGTLLEKAGIAVPQELTAMTKYVTDFDSKAKTLAALKDSVDRIGKYVKDGPQFPNDEFFKGVVARMTAVQNAMPSKIDESYGKYAASKSAEALNAEIAKLASFVSQRLAESQQAEVLVQQVNILKLQGDFHGMEGLLSQAKQLGFLLDRYRDLDRLSVEQQMKAVRTSLTSAAWQQAETGLRNLHVDQTFINPQAALPFKQAAVRDMEDSLYSTVERVTRARVNKFCEEKVTVLENVDSLYSDSVFLPVYDITFSSGSQNHLLKKKEALIADLAKLKDYDFPAKAIKLCYEQFIKNPDENGVLKARAVVTHGKHYKGDDKELKIKIAECDPLSAKWISKPKDYRRVFVLPVTDNRSRGAKNKYYIRLNVNIPTDAEFPVYDVNIKLPKEIAQNAAASQWYDQILCNKTVLKNEGRFSIGAPTAANDFECQITPVQMNKDKNNILEVNFTYPAFKPFTVSVMVQKPIIKKN